MPWTLDELADEAARALADADVRVANGRVTGVPDGRLIRWYATIGLLDRPLDRARAGPGRGARYGSRHLLQLVAIKRLQAQGRPLMEIQYLLAGATDAALRSIADLDVEPAPPALPAALNPPAVPKIQAGAALPDVSTARFWSAPIAVAPPEHEPAPMPPTVAVGGDSVERVWGFRFGGVTVLVPATVEVTAAEVAVAAQPLLDLLRHKGGADA